MPVDKAVVEIKETPEYPVDNPWMVVRYDSTVHDLKFCLSSKTEQQAEEAAKSIPGGLVVKNIRYSNS